MSCDFNRMIEQAFMKSLFHGVIAEGMVFPYPEMAQAEIDSVHRLLEVVRKFASAKIDSVKIDRDASIGESVLEGLKELGLFGMTIPTEYGGSGFSHTAYARVIQEIAGIDLSVALSLGAHQSIGLKGILLFGNDEQKRAYLPKLASGESVAAFALAEPSAGSDAAGVYTHAELSADGRAYALNGSKIWITNGGIANVFTVFARTSKREEGMKPKLTAFIAERMMGVKSGPNEGKLGVRGASTTPLYFDDVTIPAANVLGERGRGSKVAAEVLNDGRLSLASACVGICKRFLKMAVLRTQERKAFGRGIGEFGLIKDKIALMTAETYALESMVYLTTGFTDANDADFSLESAICKVAASEGLARVAGEAIQIAAGIGYMHDYPYERLFRDSRVSLIFDGTNETLRCFIALSGMQGPGKALVDVSRAMREPIKGFGLLSDFAIRKARSALGRERLTRAHPILSRETVLFEEFAAELARNTEKVLRKHGTEISEMQYTQRRIADMAIDLYGIAALLARTTRAIEKRGEEGARREIDLTTIFVTGAERRLRETVASFEKNDDELRKAIASKTSSDGGYPFDIL
jgi:acyl-CoA dehydrogenase family member 9